MGKEKDENFSIVALMHIVRTPEAHLQRLWATEYGYINVTDSDQSP